MPTTEELLDEIFAGHERVSRDEIHRRAVAADLSAGELGVLDGLPEGEYSHDEVLEAIGVAATGAVVEDTGVAPAELSDGDLLRELGSLHRTRNETFRHASTQALDHHSDRTTALEEEFLRRWPERDVDPTRLRAGARLR